MQLCGSLSILWHCLSFGLEWNWPFPVLWPLLVFHVFWHIECNTFSASSFRIWNSSTGIQSPPLALFLVMLPKAHLTLHSRMSGSRWVITAAWLSGSCRSFLYSSSVYSCHLFLISSVSVFVLYWAHLCRKYSLGISNFLEEMSSVSHSIVFLYFFALITEEGFLLSPCYSLELALITEEGFLISPCYSLELSTYIQYYVYFNSNPHLSLPSQALLISLLLHVHHYATDDLTQSHGFKYQLMVTSSSL